MMVVVKYFIDAFDGLSIELEELIADATISISSSNKPLILGTQ